MAKFNYASLRRNALMMLNQFNGNWFAFLRDTTFKMAPPVLIKAHFVKFTELYLFSSYWYYIRYDSTKAVIDLLHSMHPLLLLIRITHSSVFKGLRMAFNKWSFLQRQQHSTCGSTRKMPFSFIMHFDSSYLDHPEVNAKCCHQCVLYSALFATIWEKVQFKM